MRALASYQNGLARWLLSTINQTSGARWSDVSLSSPHGVGALTHQNSLVPAVVLSTVCRQPEYQSVPYFGERGPYSKPAGCPAESSRALVIPAIG